MQQKLLHLVLSLGAGMTPCFLELIALLSKKIRDPSADGQNPALL